MSDRLTSLPDSSGLANLTTRHESGENKSTAHHTLEERSEYSGRPAQKYFSVNEIAERLGCSRDTVLRRFANEPGVIDLAQGGRKRMLRIPLVALNRVIAESSVRN